MHLRLTLLQTESHSRLLTRDVLASRSTLV